MVDIPKKSKAAVMVDYNKPLEIRYLPIPEEIESGALLVRNELSAVCGSDVHIWHGEIKASPPNILGHENIGRIVKMGPGVKTDSVGQQIDIGDRIMWEHASCGSCLWCTVYHQYSLCPNRKYYAFSCCEEPPYLMGGFSEYAYILPNSGRVKIPQGLPNEVVMPASCALRSTIKGFERLGGLKIQETSVIQGSGPVGLCCLALAKEGGARKVIVVGAPKERLEMAKKWGADHVISLDDVPDPSERREEILKLTQGVGPDVVIECTGVPSAVGEGLDMIRRGGRYLIIGQMGGASGSPTTIPVSYFNWKELDIIGTWSGEINHYYKAIQFIETFKDKYSFDDLMSNKYSLDDANEALIAMEQHKEMKPAIAP